MGQELKKQDFGIECYEEIRGAIMKETPNIFIKQRPGRGGMTFNYIETGYVVAHLNKTFGFNWDFEVVDDKQVEDNIIVKGRLTIKDGKGNCISKMQYGSSQVKKDKSGKIVDLADDYKSATSDCLKKCASLVGLGFDVYYPSVWNVIKGSIKRKKQVEKVKVEEKVESVKVDNVEKANKLSPGIEKMQEALNNYKK